MRTVTYNSVLLQAAGLLGEPAAGPGVEKAAKLNFWINKRLRYAWNFHFWRELLYTEQRWLRPWYDAATTYAAGDEIFFPDQGVYYQALQATTGNPPATESGGVWTVDYTYWYPSLRTYAGATWVAGAHAEGTVVWYPPTQRFYAVHTVPSTEAPTDTNFYGVLTDFIPFISLTQADETEIGLIKRLSQYDPRRFKLAIEIDFELDREGILVLPDFKSVWVQFLEPPFDLTGADWSNSVTYAAGDTVYDSSTGDYYKSLIDSNTDLLTVATSWRRLSIPAIFKSYLAHGAYADALGKEEGQQEKYGSENDEALIYLVTEVDSEQRAMGQAGPLHVVTR